MSPRHLWQGRCAARRGVTNITKTVKTISKLVEDLLLFAQANLIYAGDFKSRIQMQLVLVLGSERQLSGLIFAERILGEKQQF